MSTTSGFSEEAEVAVLVNMHDRMVAARELLEDQDLDGAVDKIDGMTEDTECPLCQQIEVHLLAGLTFIRVAPDGRKGASARAVIEELNHYTDKLQEVKK